MEAASLQCYHNGAVNIGTKYSTANTKNAEQIGRFPNERFKIHITDWTFLLLTFLQPGNLLKNQNHPKQRNGPEHNMARIHCEPAIRQPKKDHETQWLHHATTKKAPRTRDQSRRIGPHAYGNHKRPSWHSGDLQEKSRETAVRLGTRKLQMDPRKDVFVWMGSRKKGRLHRRSHQRSDVSWKRSWDRDWESWDWEERVHTIHDTLRTGPPRQATGQSRSGAGVEVGMLRGKGAT